MIATDSRIPTLPQLHCSRYREKLNTAMWNSYQNIINRISSKVDSWIFDFYFFLTEVSILQCRAGIEQVILDFPGFLHL